MKHLQLLLIIFLSWSAGQAPAQSPAVYVGITADKFDYIASAQNNSKWCWAASIQMIFNYYGIDVNQEQIVRNTFSGYTSGKLPDFGGNERIITANLNQQNIDNSGKQYLIAAELNKGAPTPSYLINELASRRPVLIGYRTGFNTGHAVLITACSYFSTKNGPVIRSIVVRDPWPSKENLRTAGRIEYWGESLASLIESHWYVRVTIPSPQK